MILIWNGEDKRGIMERLSDWMILDPFLLLESIKLDNQTRVLFIYLFSKQHSYKHTEKYKKHAVTKT